MVKQHLQKKIFFDPGTVLHPLMALTMRGPGYLLAPSSDHRVAGLVISLGDFEAWKPQKMGGCVWTRCPHGLDLSHVAQHTARSWFRAILPSPLFTASQTRRKKIIQELDIEVAGRSQQNSTLIKCGIFLSELDQLVVLANKAPLCQDSLNITCQTAIAPSKMDCLGPT